MTRMGRQSAVLIPRNRIRGVGDHGIIIQTGGRVALRVLSE